jgi:YggT family protein
MIEPMEISFFLQVLAQTLSIYTFVLVVRVLLSWFPNLDWSNPLLASLSSITDPYLNIFRGLIPPIGGLDLSALIAFFALQISSGLISQLALSTAPGFASFQ